MISQFMSLTNNSTYKSEQQWLFCASGKILNFKHNRSVSVLLWYQV